MTLRLLKVICQPVFVDEDENGNLTELVAEPQMVSAAEWPTYATNRFVAQVAAISNHKESECLTSPLPN